MNIQASITCVKMGGLTWVSDAQFPKLKVPKL